MATAWHTVAAGKGYPIGTIIYIPALSDRPNGGWFEVEDRGGAISNEKMDVFFNTHEEAIQFGRKSLDAYIYIPQWLKNKEKALQFPCFLLLYEKLNLKIYLRYKK